MRWVKNHPGDAFGVSRRLRRRSLFVALLHLSASILVGGTILNFRLSYHRQNVS